MEDKKKILKETLPEYTVENKEYKTMPKKWTIDGKDRYIGEQDQSSKMWYEHIYQFDDLIDDVEDENANENESLLDKLEGLSIGTGCLLISSKYPKY